MIFLKEVVALVSLQAEYPCIRKWDALGKKGWDLDEPLLHFLGTCLKVFFWNYISYQLLFQ